MRGAGSRTPSSSRSAWRRRSWASPPTAGSSPSHASASSISSRSCPASPLTGSAGGGWPTRSSGSWACSPPRARASVTTCCWSTRPRCPAPPAVRRPSARRSQTPPATATAAATRAGTGASAAICWPLPTARRGPSRSPIPPAASVRWRSSCWQRAARGGEVLVCDKGYAGREFAAGAGEHGVLVVRPARKDEPGPRAAPGAHPPAHREHLLDLQGPAHARASRRPHPGRACASASCSASSASPPASASTTGWADPAGHSSTTAPEAAAWNQSSRGWKLRERAHRQAARHETDGPAAETAPGIGGELRHRCADLF